MMADVQGFSPKKTEYATLVKSFLNKTTYAVHESNRPAWQKMEILGNCSDSQSNVGATIASAHPQPDTKILKVNNDGEQVEVHWTDGHLGTYTHNGCMRGLLNSAMSLGTDNAENIPMWPNKLDPKPWLYWRQTRPPYRYVMGGTQTWVKE
ncbi:hypothetical protein GWK47_045032 [Chionoecetes opilio]|uniref:Uncharacterized protein n=1 Tax=Chionoecetes opilio TaxID=41210 RepID=A0A8J5CXX9_CHIOP|nr:hypothetical protein GWK47_045032 [Chionoecetes opilio]